MRKPMTTFVAVMCLAAAGSMASAQATDAPPAKRYGNSPIVTRMMAFDKKHDGKLIRDEITDERLLRLFDQADANKDGVVTREELTALAAKLDADAPQERGGPGGPGGPPGGFDGGPRGRGGPRGFGPPPRPGEVLPPMLQERLQLTDEQKRQVAELQKEVDAKLARILTSEQMDQLKRMRQRGPGRGPGGPGGPGGPPPPPDER